MNADVVVYGDTSGGVIAAVQAANMGKQVLLISPTGHLGGMTGSGLGWSDTGSPAILGGLSRQFYHQVYAHYQQDSAWYYEKRSAFSGDCQGLKLFDDEEKLSSVFEPKVAEAIFSDWVARANVNVITGRLHLEQKLPLAGGRLTSIRLEDGSTVSGQMFIDASYEGDLLALAGVSFVVGRESNADFDEQCNGITGPLPKNQLPDGIDPYIVPGDASSGLLAGVHPKLNGEVGDGDAYLQSYCYRMVLTDVPENRIPIEKPENYNETDYEILFRAIEVGYTGPFFKTDLVPNRKTDGNNTGGISCDFIGGNFGPDWSWERLGHADRETVATRHRDWQLGLLWTLQHHERVPEKIRQEISVWGLAKDEFVDNGHWPYQLYIREARRMRSAVVMTEKHCRNELTVEDPVGMGAYTLDSHNTQRVIHAGMVKNEGDIQSPLHRKPYGISYRSLIPSVGECRNLLVPWALSATHIAFGSIRMEPVFMILGQSVATAACLCLDRKCSVQDLPYAVLRERLLVDDQRLGGKGKAL